MHTGFSRAYGSWFFDCLYGCHGYDYESDWEAQQAFLSHVCTSAGSEVPC